MSGQQQGQDHKHDTGGYEKRDVHVPKTLVVTVIIVLAIIASVVFVGEIFVHTKEQMVSEYVLQPESVQLRELRANETEKLTTYAILDAEKGIYRIPIERAMRLIAEQSYSQEVERRTRR